MKSWRTIKRKLKAWLPLLIGAIVLVEVLLTSHSMLVVSVRDESRLMYTKPVVDGHPDDVGNKSLGSLLDNARLPKELQLPERPLPVQELINMSSSNGNDAEVGAGTASKLDPQDLRILQLAFDINRRQRIYNQPSTSPLSDESSLVIVVQIHNRLKYLKQLLDSLRKVRNINRALLVFSHDYYSDDLFRLIHTVDFCPYMQMFYPYPMQVYKDQFPGPSVGDCSRNDKPSRAKVQGCLNAEYPDKYGHYREAGIVQTKHHWWWKVNRIFRDIEVTRNFSGLVMFLEDDHYVTPDFMHVAHTLQHAITEKHPDVSFITLGTYDKSPNFNHADRYSSGNWISSRHNMGFGFTRKAWVKIFACSKAFCEFDDYNWDWSLQYIGMTCIPEGIKALVSKAPRVFHNGECGMHGKKTCGKVNEIKRIKFIRDIIAQNTHRFFPPVMNVLGGVLPRLKATKPNGGWGDIRDRQLCRVFNNTTEPVNVSRFNSFPRRR